jgi:hypothetical protein
MQHTSQHLQHCIDNCTRCHQSCLSMIEHCQKQGGAHARPEHIRLLQDCAQICQTSADFMLRHSPLHHLTCGACAQICELCALECEKMASGDSMMQECASICRACAQSCAEMSQMQTR